jgi:hypothetical protein
MQTRRSFLAGSGLLGLGTLAACSRESSQGQEVVEETSSVDTSKFNDLAVDMGAWNYDETNDVWYQLCVRNCLTPASPTCECLSIFVPGAYMDGKKGSSAWSCTVVPDAGIGIWTAKTAPIVFGLNAPGFSAQTPSSTYSFEGLDPFMAEGCVYVFPGMRGRSSGYEKVDGKDSFYAGGAPWAVTDLKASALWYRYNAASLPGDPGRIYVFGLGAGGGLATVLGSTGNAPEYEPYLDSIGAARWDMAGTTIADSVRGVCVWNPLASLGEDDGAYEWLYGQYADDSSRSEGTWTKVLSERLASKWAEDLNECFFAVDGESLTLDETPGSANYADGSYYEYVLDTIERSAKDFFDNTQFPTTITGEIRLNPGFPGGQNSSADLESSVVSALLDHAKLVAGADSDEVKELGGETVSNTYDTSEEYVRSLNALGDDWFVYNERRSTVRVSSIGSYVQACAPATRPCTAYDAVECNSLENQLFGVEDDSTLHYSKQISDTLNASDDAFDGTSGWSGNYLASWNYDLLVKDELGTSVSKRVDMYDPLYYLNGSRRGYGTAYVAKDWRIQVGLGQSVVPVTTGINLALAASAYSGVNKVDLGCVWASGMTMSEISGDPLQNAFAWMESVFQGEQSE